MKATGHFFAKSVILTVGLYSATSRRLQKEKEKGKKSNKDKSNSQESITTIIFKNQIVCGPPISSET